MKSARKKADAEKSGEPEEKIVAFESPAAETVSARAAHSTQSTSGSEPAKSSKSRQRPKPSKPTRQGQPTPPAEKPPSEKSAGSRPAVDSRVLSTVRRAMKDLDAGKTVAAYKRLEALVAEAEKEKG